MAKPLLVGITNPHAGQAYYSEALYPAPEGCTGHRLWQMIRAVSGTSRGEYLAKFGRTNLDEPEFPGMLERARVVVPLGRVAWGHFRLPTKSQPMEWVWRDGKNYALVPHPSGRNLWYNDPENRRRVGEFLAALVE